MYSLRPYQAALKEQILKKYSEGERHILAVLPTGAGKTVVISDLLNTLKVPAIVMAHRTELVTQVSLDSGQVWCASSNYRVKSNYSKRD